MSALITPAVSPSLSKAFGPLQRGPKKTNLAQISTPEPFRANEEIEVERAATGSAKAFR